ADTAYRSKVCFDWSFYCRGCIVAKHGTNPLHVVEQWTSGNFLHDVELATLGLIFHLNHSAEHPCPSAYNHEPRSFTLVGALRLQPASIKFCACEQGHTDRSQLLQHRLFPATVTAPQ
ncbi:hypothetical protein BDP27DRAFT_1148806, partial [Rhodocollybia butyracea]